VYLACGQSIPGRCEASAWPATRPPTT